MNRLPPHRCIFSTEHVRELVALMEERALDANHGHLSIKGQRVLEAEINKRLKPLDVTLDDIHEWLPPIALAEDCFESI